MSPRTHISAIPAITKSRRIWDWLQRDSHSAISWPIHSHFHEGTVIVLRQRSHRELTPQKLLSEVFWSPLDWPSKTIRLEKNGAYEVRHRSLSGAISPAELYHENSKLTASTLQSYTASEINPDEVKIEFARRRSAIAKKTTTVPLNLAAPFRKLLTDVAKTTWPQLFYSIELRVVAAALAAIHEPLSDTLSVVKRLSAGDVERMH